LGLLAEAPTEISLSNPNGGEEKTGRDRMDWILFVSLQWIVFGSPTQPSTQQIQSFPSEELCNKAAEAIRNEINAPIPGQRVQTLGRVVCLLRKDK
jgi:hypothetical protein